MTTINSICEFLNQAGCQFHVYDMGRVIREIDSQTFLDIEYNKAPYPYPIQKHALVAIAFWNPSLSQQHYLWFLKLPLDEQSMLIAASRNDFLEKVVNALGKQMEQLTEEEQNKLQQENPYIFQPATHKRACIHSLLTQRFQLPESTYYLKALEDLNKGNWQTVGLQGLADICMALNKEQHASLIEALLSENIHPELLANLIQLLENTSLNQKITHQIINLLNAALENNNQALMSDCIRALSQSHAELNLRAMKKLFSAPVELTPDLLVVLAARQWRCLSDAQLKMQYFEKLAATENTHLFKQIFADLVAIPEIRTHILEILRTPERSDALAKSIGALFQQHDRSA